MTGRQTTWPVIVSFHMYARDPNSPLYFNIGCQATARRHPLLSFCQWAFTDAHTNAALGRLKVPALQHALTNECALRGVRGTDPSAKSRAELPWKNRCASRGAARLAVSKTNLILFYGAPNCRS